MAKLPFGPSLNVEMSAGVVLGSATNNALAVANVLTKSETLCYLGVIDTLIVSADRDRGQKTNHGHDND